MTRYALAFSLLFVPGLLFAAPSKKIVAELGKEFVLRRGQTVALKGTDAAIRITGFINSPCPNGARCVWSGQAVNLELTIAGSTIALDGSTPYLIETRDSDYKTRATLKVSKRPLGK